MNNLQHNLIDKIKSGEIDMKPKWHFVLRSAMLVAGFILALILTIYLLSFLFFFLHQSGVFFTPGFGARGIGFFIMSSPWILIGVSLVFLSLVYFLVRQYSFSYQRPLVYSMLSVIMIATAGSWLVQQLPMHQKINAFIERNEVPVLAPLYRDAIDGRLDGLVVGTITEVTEAGFVIDSVRDGLIEVEVTERTKMKRDTTPVVGNSYMVVGEEEDGVITAIGIRPQDEKTRPLQRLRELREQRLDREQRPQFERGTTTEYQTRPVPQRSLPANR